MRRDVKHAAHLPKTVKILQNDRSRRRRGDLGDSRKAHQQARNDKSKPGETTGAWRGTRDTGHVTRIRLDAR